MMEDKLSVSRHILEAIRSLRRTIPVADIETREEVKTIIHRLEEMMRSSQMRSDKIIHSGYVLGHDPESTRTFYFVDDVDALPPDIRDYKRHEIKDFSWMRLMGKVREGEYDNNYKYVVQIGDMYYETVEEDG